MSDVSSNTLPKLTDYRNRYIRILAPFVEAQNVKTADLADLKTEFDSAFKDEFDRETRALQWAGLALNAKRHFADAEKLAKAEQKVLVSQQYELFAE
jgi:hypothetical protein